MSRIRSRLAALACLAAASACTPPRSTAPPAAGSSAAPPPPVAAAGGSELPWSQAGADAGRTGSTPDPGPETQPGLLWHSPVEPSLVTEPVRAQSGGASLLICGTGTHVAAFDAGTGRTRWSMDTGSAVDASPTVMGDRILAVGADGVADVLSLADGTRIKKLEFDFLLEGSPVRAGSVIAFEETSSSRAAPTSILHALDPATLALGWGYEYPLGTGGLPAADASRVYVAVVDGVRAATLADGKEAWVHAGPKQPQRQGPVVRAGKVVMVSGGMAPWTANALEAATGKPAWSVKLADRVSAALSATDDEVLVPLMNGTLARLALADGKVGDPIAIPTIAGGRPAISPHRVYVPCGKQVVALDRATWKPAWTMDFDGDVAFVTVSGSTLVVVRQDGWLDCLGG